MFSLSIIRDESGLGIKYTRIYDDDDYENDDVCFLSRFYSTSSIINCTDAWLGKVESVQYSSVYA